MWTTQRTHTQTCTICGPQSEHTQRPAQHEDHTVNTHRQTCIVCGLHSEHTETYTVMWNTQLIHIYLDSYVEHTVNTNEPAQYVDHSEHTETCRATWTTQRTQTNLHSMRTIVNTHRLPQSREPHSEHTQTCSHMDHTANHIIIEAHTQT